MWTERRNGTLAAGTYYIGTSGPSTTDDWAMVALEILAGP
jgi:hypothetical protein